MTNHEQRAFEALTVKLNEAGYTYEDTSWGNDATASISVTCQRLVGEEVEVYEFQIYIPNSDIFDPENECYNTYTCAEEGLNIINNFYRPEDLIEHIQDCTRDVIFTN